MTINEDGSVTFSQEAFEKLKDAYNDLYSIIDSMPSSLSDFLDHDEYVNVCKWEASLNGNPFDPSEFE